MKHHLAGTRFNSEPCSKVPDDVRVMFLKLLQCREEESDAKKRKLEQIISGSQEENTTAENEQGRGDQLANKGKAQTTVNQFYKKQEREEVCIQICRFFYTSAISFNAVKNP